MPDGKTIVFGVAGNPIDHTLSPFIHDIFIKGMGLNAAYLPFPAAEGGRVPDGVRALGLAGLNITIPHKQAVIPHLDEVDEYARLAGAVNTIVHNGGRLTGFNTDGYGFIKMLERAGIEYDGKTIGVIGAGGAAKGICLALRDKARFIIINRTPGKAEQLCAGLNGRAGDWGDFRQADVVVNATSVGMHPQAGDCPLPDFDLLKPGAAVCDLIYNPRRTLLLERAEERGHVAVNGMAMLIFQAARAFWHFTGENPSPHLIEQAFTLLDNPKNIILTGFMATGKSTVAAALSRKLALELIDTDKLIEQNHHRPISEIFAREGQDYFRQAEREAISSASMRRGAVIAVGGGAPCFAENMNNLRRNGIVVRLKADIDRILQNIGDAGTRPNIAGKSRDDIIRLMDSREPYYRECDIELDTTNKNIEEISECIIERLTLYASN